MARLNSLPKGKHITTVELTPSRKWLFRITTSLIIPLLALGALEGGLRLAGYGYATSLFQRVRVEGRDHLINNQRFGLRFFSPEVCFSTLPIKMEPTKPPDTFRVFIFGESAAQGDPTPCCGAWRYLEVLLRERYPGVHFEVINLGIASISSHVVLPIARECAACQGDLWLVYMGNNEMIGPFGAATVFGAKALPWPVVRGVLALKTTRTGQLLSDLASKLSGQRPPRVWTGMTLFLGNEVPPNDARREIVYNNFERNLQDIVRAGRKAGAQVVLSTVAVNLKDCSPFASVASSNLSPANQESIKRSCAEGRAAELGDDWKQAASAYGAAIALDPKMADAQFYEGQSLEHLNRFAEAASCFQTACDCDALPFRADSRINGIIRRTSRSLAGPDLVLCDAAATLLDHGGPAGHESFFDHVHLNFDGNYRVALLWAAAAERLLPKEVKEKAASAWASQQLCEARLGLTDLNRAEVVSQMLQRLARPPYNAQFNNSQYMLALTNQLKAVAQHSDATAIANARALCIDAIARAPQDYMLYLNYARFLQKIGQYHEAALEWKQVAESMPYDAFALAAEGECLVLDRNFTSAHESFSRAVTLDPSFALAWRKLGDLDTLQGNEEKAIKEYRRADHLQPNDPQTYLSLGEALARLKRLDESVQYLQRAVQLQKDYWPAHYELGEVFSSQGRLAEAKDQLQQAVSLNPGLVQGHVELGAVLFKLNELEAARQHFERALQLDRNNQTARAYLVLFPR